MDEIGDFVLWIEAARAMRTIYPQEEYRITLVGNALWIEMARAVLPYDNFIGINKRRFINDPIYRTSQLFKIRRTKYSIALNPQYSRQYYFDDTIIHISRAEQKVGFYGDLENISNSEKNRSDHWYTTLIRSNDVMSMELLRNAEFTRNLGATDFRAAIPSLGTDKYFSKSTFFIVFPGAGSPSKCWPPEYFSNLIQTISVETGLDCVICGGPGEINIGEKIIKLSSNIPIDNQAGKTTLMELSRLLSQARFLVSNDTSAVHIAAAVGTTSFCLLGGGHFGRFLPYSVEETKSDFNMPCAIYSRMPCFNCGWSCKYDLPLGTPYPCITNISVSMVAKIILADLEHGKSHDVVKT